MCANPVRPFSFFVPSSPPHRRADPFLPQAKYGAMALDHLTTL
jgi:hypothetical protein